MFGSSKKQKSKTSNNSKPITASSNALNSLVQGTFIEGKINASSDIRIDGTIKGELKCDTKVIIGATGSVEGIVRCKNAVIEGRFEGTLVVQELLNIRETAKVTGEVGYGKLVVQSGAVISGSYKVAGEGSNGSFKAKDTKKLVSNAKSDLQKIAGKTQHSHS
ncbi:MAG TPA: polymer-forming cytoskeletal protein [Bacteroidetes bacterium]|nr:polymer-forming cytoskeletal protein [Bacteroidota bacterium]